MRRFGRASRGRVLHVLVAYSRRAITSLSCGRTRFFRPKSGITKKSSGKVANTCSGTGRLAARYYKLGRTKGWKGPQNARFWLPVQNSHSRPVLMHTALGKT